MSHETGFKDIRKKIETGGAPKNHEKNAQSGKLFARERIRLLCDPGSFVEDGAFAHCLNEEFPADGVITGFGKVLGRKIAVLANDSTIKAGSWGARTVEKMIRLQEAAERLKLPVFYLVDSAGARITDQLQMFPGRRGAGRIFYNQSRLSGVLPQICLLFGPSAAGGAYIPSFCDVVIMVEKNASMYLGSPRMAEEVIGEKVSLEEMGGARMHCSVSGCGDFLVQSEQEAIELAKKYFAYTKDPLGSSVKSTEPVDSARKDVDLASLIPSSPTRAYDIRGIIEGISDAGSFLEVKELYAREIVTGFARLKGRAIGVVANQPLHKGGVLFVESSNKAARFIQLCNSYRVPLLFLSDVPGFMIGSKVEKEGMIRAGAKMIYAMSNAEVPKICVVVRKSFGAGLYAMSGPAFGSDAVLALPTAQIAVMGAEPAINAVYFNKMAEMKPEEKKEFVEKKKAEYEKEIDILRLAGELVVEDLVDFIDLRSTLAQRFEYYERTAEPAGRGARMPGILPM